MAIFLEIIEGSMLGTRHAVGSGVRIGRVGVEILVDDPKVSSIHAVVENDAKGQFILVDVGSSNGILVNRNRVKKVILLPGTTFQVGKTVFKVINVLCDEDMFPEPEAGDWQGVLKKYLGKSNIQYEEPREDLQVSAFNPAVRLNFLEGFQADTEWTLGYGPRLFGTMTLEHQILEPDAPDVCFEIFPTDAGPKFQTQYPDSVLLNNKSISSDKLNNGDLIQIGKTKIKVSLE